MSMKKRWGILTAMAVVFGLIARGIMYGINYTGGRIYREQHISSTDTAETQKCGIRKKDSTVATAVRTIVVLAFSWLIVWIVGSGSQISQISGMVLDESC